jgi:L,D-peptidoglycan transpeptidase YkuD (ErfK/YbiS/YcfS/YnhG family)
MGLRFRKRIKIFSGLWLNVSKSGISTSIGRKGLTVNLKRGKSKATASIPGTGLSYSATTKDSPSDPAQARRASNAWLWVFLIVIVALVLIFN